MTTRPNSYASISVSYTHLVAENELDDTATFFEVKRKAENIDMEKLEAKAAAFMRATGEFKGYSDVYKRQDVSGV